MHANPKSARVKKIVGVIPARLESTRLPRKPLLLICGHPMVAWVYARARAAKELSQLMVATDSDEVLEWCRSLRIPALITSPAHRSGVDRVAEVMALQSREGEAADVYVNIQGDEPAVSAEHIRLLVQPFLNDPQTEISTLKVAMTRQDAIDPNKVKVVTDHDGRALYFSRSPIPYDRDGQWAGTYYKHLGFYAYSTAALEKIRRLRPGSLERAEHLEQLRFLENTIRITVVESQTDTSGVDTMEDLVAVQEHFKRSGVKFPELPG
ncbi:MAG: 3-deoxy-manno-octulosonate cytidylyltransferase [Terriglobia bacterium]